MEPSTPQTAEPSGMARTEQEQAERSEGEIRAERLEALRQRTEQLFPGENLKPLRSQIERSFDVPQWGPHHHEGMFMDAHLATIINGLADAKEGKVAGELSEDDKQRITAVAQSRTDDLVRYALLHDIAKPDAMTIKYAGREKGQDTEEPTWEEWVGRLPAEAKVDPEALRAYLEEQGIASISYFQKENKKQHGAMGAELAENTEGIPVDNTIIAAIRHHEVAYQFEKIKVDTYEKYFGAYDDPTQDLILTVNYLDAVGSHGEGGQLDLSSVEALFASAANFRITKELNQLLAEEPGLDQDKVKKHVSFLRQSPERLQASLSILAAEARAVCQPTQYDLERVRQSLADAGEAYTAEEREAILAAASTGDLKPLGPVLKKKMGSARQLLGQAEVQ